MSAYWAAGSTAAVALLVMVAFGVWAVVTVRRFRALAVAYRRYVSAESALLGHRRAELAAELARRRVGTRRA